MLEVARIDTYYGDARALEKVSLTLAESEIVAVLGPNGAGKTTLAHSIAGIQRIRSGTVSLDGVVLSSLRPSEVINHGLAIVPENRRLFASMSVLENLQMGAYSKRSRGNASATQREVFELFPRLAERRHQAAGTMSGGEQQMLAIARALMSQPRYVVMDEPSLGLAPVIVDQLFDLILQVNQRGVAVLLIEQNVARALELCARGYVLEEGQIRLTGTREELLASDEIRRAYFGL